MPKAFFEPDDLQVDLEDLVGMSDKDRKIAALPIVEIAEDTVKVGSQSSVLEWHEVVHFDGIPVRCDCLYSTHHPYDYELIEGEEPIKGNQCKAHFRRLEMAVEKRNRRVASTPLTKQATVSVKKDEAARQPDQLTVDVKVEVNVSEQASLKRVNAPLHVKPFSILGN